VTCLSHPEATTHVLVKTHMLAAMFIALDAIVWASMSGRSRRALQPHVHHASHLCVVTNLPEECSNIPCMHPGSELTMLLTLLLPCFMSVRSRHSLPGSRHSKGAARTDACKQMAAEVLPNYAILSAATGKHA
jgi:hypothetical protein